MTTRSRTRTGRALAVFGLVALLAAAPFQADASSHAEAPFIAQNPRVDGTDFYMFRSYEPGRQGFVTLIANYVPLQDAYGGPNYFALDENALYEIHIDNNADAVEDLTFQFRPQNVLKDIQLPIGPPDNQEMISIPLVQVGPITAGDDSQSNVTQNYSLTLVQGDRRTGTAIPINKVGGDGTFTKPQDHIGTKTFPDYAAYADQFVYDIDLPGTEENGRVFVGQRKESFVVNLGEVFDLVNTNPLGPVDGECDDLEDKNITSFVLELPISFLTAGDPVIGGWTSASLRQARVLNPNPQGFGDAEVVGGAFSQVSRLSTPLINEVIIGLKDKDRFNASEPKDDAQFLQYVQKPTLPALLEALFSVPAPQVFPREDLIAAFLTGVDGLNKYTAGPVTPTEMLRLNTDIDPTPRDLQSNLGALDGDAGGFPNGRRPGDDVVDIELRVAMGALLPPAFAPAGNLPFTDGAVVDATFFDDAFPYLRDPIPGSPNGK